MGRTLQSATQTWVEEEKALKRFMRALRRDEQELMVELIGLSRLHIAEASYASNLYPMDLYLMSMLLETHKKLRVLENQMEQVCGKLGIETAEKSAIAGLPDLKSLIAAVEQTPEAE